MSRFAPLFLALILSTFFGIRPANAWIHMARAGETLEQLSVRYYGTPKKAVVLRAANGFVHPDSGRLTEGEPVEIPEVHYIRIGEADTWQTLAAAFLSSPDRAKFLAKLNGSDVDKTPPPGTLVRIPFHLRHIFATDESLKTIVKLYYENRRSAEWLRRYNGGREKKYGRGDVVIVPLWNLEFTEEEQARVDAFRAGRFTRLDRQRQEAARETISSLKTDLENGRYVEIVAKASQLIGNNRLTVPQEIGVHNYLAYAYVALDEPKLAVESFQKALALQPDMELSPLTTSPKILKVFNRAKQELSDTAGAPTAP